MNLNAYDNIIDKIDKTKTWIDIHKKIIISREIQFRPYISLLKRYDNKTNTTSYFIATLNNPPDNHKYKHTKIDNYGRLKFSLASIWNETCLFQFDKDCNIMISHVESDDDGDIYLLDI